MRPIGFGASAAQTLTSKRLHSYQRANLVAIDINVADVGSVRELPGAAVDAGLDTHRQAITERVDLCDHRLRIVPPAQDVQHRSK